MQRKYEIEKKEKITTNDTISMSLSPLWLPKNSNRFYYTGTNVWTVNNVLLPGECIELIKKSEGLGFTEASLTMSDNNFVIRPDIRNNKRVIWDDKNFAVSLWERLKLFVPVYCNQLLGHEKIGHGYKVHDIGCNERFRFYRYEERERFNPHYDGHFSRQIDNHTERSFLTCIIYLNTVNNGGETKFFGTDNSTGNEFVKFAIKPIVGSCLFFAHQGNLHEGSMIPAGSKEVKYVIRTDIMYTNKKT